MSEIYVYTLFSVVLVSTMSLVGLFTLSMSERFLRRCVFIFVGVSVGALLGDALVHLIPESVASLGIFPASALVAGGIVLFLLIEKYLHWHHHEPEMHDGHIHPAGKMILFSDGIHNFLDGIIIAASYVVSIEVGIATTIAVMLHEIPQEIGDFGVLLHSGYTKSRALYLNFLSAVLAIVGAGVGLWLGTEALAFEMVLVPIAAGGFLYIAIVDLLPELHKTQGRIAGVAQVVAVVIGFLVVALL